MVDMADSYFDLLTHQQELPAKPFDPLEELKLLRRKLALRMQTGHPSNEPVPPCAVASSLCDAENVSLETIVDKVQSIEATLSVWHCSRKRSRVGTKLQRNNLYRSIQRRGNPLRINRQHTEQKHACLTVAQHLEVPASGILRVGHLEAINAGLTSLGMIGAVFGLFSFFRGWEGDLPLGSWVCASGATIILVGLTGRLLASSKSDR